LYALGPISLGRATTVSQNSHLCAGSHDYRHADRPLTKPPITIGDSVWICADAFVGPGVNIGDGAIVGARAVVIKNVPEQTIVAGNPAREINHLD
jgi:putative colanic acid biosynthesis acetyltransferase WcaF